MSDYHILAASENGFRITVAFHIPVPGGTNIVGKSYADCLLESGRATMMSSVPNHATDFSSEAADLQNGIVLEVIDSIEVRFQRNTPKNEIRAMGKAAIEDKFRRIKTKKQNQIPLMFRYWGFSGDVP